MVSTDTRLPIHQPILTSQTGFTDAIATERDWLVRWFGQRCGNWAIAEDLAQETLIEAWRIRDRFTDVTRGARPWLAAIARNVLLRWQRAAGSVRLDPLAPEVAAALPSRTGDDLDPVWFSEQDDLRNALGRALESVPPAARDLLVRRYLREESIAEIALAEEQSAAHIGVRLQRARNAVRKAIDELFPADFAEELVGISPTITNATRLWCPTCGRARLEKTIFRDGSSYYLRCPACTVPDEGHCQMGWFRPPGYEHHDLPGGDVPFSPRLSARDLHEQTFGQLWATMLHDDRVRCPHCAEPLYTLPTFPQPDADPDRNITFCCPRCGDLHQSGNLSSVAMNHPLGVTFWRDEGHIRTDPIREATIAGQPGVLVTLHGVERTASLTFGLSADATRVLLIDDRTHSTP